jgi:hypothetical protein
VPFIHVRLRENLDDDIFAWYESQGDKSGAVREAIRLARRLQNGESQEAIVKEAVSRELARLPEVIATAVREALASYRLTPFEPVREPGTEDPELAARLNEQLDTFFKD